MEKTTKFDVATAFKALDELETPIVGSAKNIKELTEAIKTTPKADALVEDYYEVGSKKDLEIAKEDREEEIAQAKLAKIEKIVDLDAETPEEILPTYVGKTIIQCPQCMTMFYKDPADLNISEDDSSIVNVGEPCQHCGNKTGYTVIGKVAEETLEEPSTEEAPNEATEENELNLDFADEKVDVVEEPKDEEELDLEPVEVKEESLTSKVADTLIEDFTEKPAELTEASVGDIAAEVLKNEKFKEISATTLKKLIKVMAEDSLDNKKAKDITAEEFIEWFGDSIAEVIFSFGDVLTDLEIRKLGVLDPKFIEACKKVEVFNMEHQDPNYPISDEEVVELAVDDGSTEAISEIEKAYKELNEAVEDTPDTNIEETTEDETMAIDEPVETDSATEEPVEMTTEEIATVVEETAAEVADAVQEIVETTEEQVEEIAEKVDEIVVNKVEEVCPEVEEVAADEVIPEEDANELIPEEDVEEAFNHGTIESTQELKGTDNAVVDCEVAKVVAHSEDEKPLDCKMEKAPLEKPLTEDSELPAPTDANIDKMLDSAEFEKPISEAEVDSIIADSKNEALEENLDSDMIQYNAYVEYLKKMLAQDEEALEKAKKMKNNEFAIKVLEKRIEADKADLDAALPNIVKEKAAEEELPSPDEAGVDAKNEALVESEKSCEGCNKKLTDLEDIKDEALVECISKSLVEVYENVDSFTLTDCSLVDDKLIIEGKINFKSGTTRDTKYVFCEACSTGDTIELTGVNEELTANGEFKLSGKIESNALVAESLGYKYNIDENLVEGLVSIK